MNRVLHFFLGSSLSFGGSIALLAFARMPFAGKESIGVTIALMAFTLAFGVMLLSWGLCHLFSAMDRDPPPILMKLVPGIWVSLFALVCLGAPLAVYLAPDREFVAPLLLPIPFGLAAAYGAFRIFTSPLEEAAESEEQATAEALPEKLAA